MKLYVFAGNRHQYEYFCNNILNITPSAACYISRPEVVQGLTLHPAQVIRYGDWYERDDFHEIETNLDIAMLKHRNAERESWKWKSERP